MWQRVGTGPSAAGCVPRLCPQSAVATCRPVPRPLHPRCHSAVLSHVAGQSPGGQGLESFRSPLSPASSAAAPGAAPLRCRGGGLAERPFSGLSKTAQQCPGSALSLRLCLGRRRARHRLSVGILPAVSLQTSFSVPLLRTPAVLPSDGGVSRPPGPSALHSSAALGPVLGDARFSVPLPRF